MDPRDRLDKSKNFMERLGSLEYFLFVMLITKLCGCQRRETCLCRKLCEKIREKTESMRILTPPFVCPFFDFFEFLKEERRVSITKWSVGRLFWPIGHRIDFMDPRDRLDKSKNFYREAWEFGIFSVRDVVH